MCYHYKMVTASEALKWAKSKKKFSWVKQDTKVKDLTKTKKALLISEYEKSLARGGSASKMAKPKPKTKRITFDEVYGLNAGQTYINDWSESLVEKGFTDRGAFREAKKLVNQYLKIVNKQKDQTPEKALKYIKQEEKKKGN